MSPKIAQDYWQRIREEADRRGSDGCTLATAAFRDCCRRHDLEYDGYEALSRRKITRQEADDRFLACMQNRSRLGWYTPIGWLRYWMVRWRGTSRWRGDAEGTREVARETPRPTGDR